MLLADGGPDFSPEHVSNVVYYFRLFVKLNAGRTQQDIQLTILSNNLLSPTSNRLTGVAYPTKLQGESNPPCKQSISAAMKNEQEFTLFNKALDGLEQAFSNVSFDGFPVSVNKILLRRRQSFVDGHRAQIRLCLKTPVRKLHEFS